MSDVPIKKPVLLGKIAATQGIKGLLRVAVYSGDFETILSLDSLMLKSPAGVMETLQVSSAAVQGRKLVIGFRGYDDINRVLWMVGHELYTDRSQMPVLEEGEYYWCDLIGLRVETDSGQFLGELADIIATGSNDVYVVKEGGREYLIPALEDIVLDVDLDAGIMKVSPPEGLLDL